MFKQLFFILSFFSLALAGEKGLRGLTFLDQNDEWKQFNHFQERFSKKYETLQELEERFQVFRANVRNIILHNLDHTQNFTLGINQFTDLTSQEFKDT